MYGVAITACAAVTALGDGVDALWDGLMQGRSGITPVTRFECRNYVSNYGACIEGVEPAQTPEQSSALDTILERVALQLEPLPTDTRLLVASTKGEIDCLSAARRHGT
ncbi:MAG: beta-ketoacyl synthase N-terminal-like domain-containing protein, partial [Desulfuromonadaceae bacterium]|nr:beta-ketoacyl synthase N-terminal-like domain-containing protein [Desulfuromonadaceae bacterium]